MDAEDKNKDVDMNEMAVSIGVDSELIGQVRRGEITHLIVGIDEDNQNFILENVQGNLVLVTDETPETFHGCYYYNGGEFPYAIKDSLTFLELDSGEDHCLLHLISHSKNCRMPFPRWSGGKAAPECC